jgi:hypothetical protein
MTKKTKRNTVHDVPLPIKCTACPAVFNRQERANEFCPQVICPECGERFLLTEQLIRDARERKGKWVRDMIERYGSSSY